MATTIADSLILCGTGASCAVFKRKRSMLKRQLIIGAMTIALLSACGVEPPHRSADDDDSGGPGGAGGGVSSVGGSSGVGGLGASGGGSNVGGGTGVGGGSAAGGGGGGSLPAVPTMVSVGDGYACVVMGDAAVKCWGRNDYGQLGDGSHNDRATPPRAATLANVREVAAGGRASCAVMLDNSVKCWGADFANNHGVLGTGDTNGSTIPVDVQGEDQVDTVSTYGTTSCAVRTNGTTICWGANGFGQLGNGNTQDQYVPTLVAGLPSSAKVANGAFFSCALMNGDFSRCWGMNALGQLGDGTNNSASTPQGNGVNYVVSLAAGALHTCVARGDFGPGAGGVRCWGDGAYGALGNGSTADHNAAVTAAGITTAVAVTAGSGHSCALLSDGTMLCWGNNDDGQLGAGVSNSQLLTPTPVVGLTGAVVQIDASGHNTCALQQDGRLYCWGVNDHGQLGNGTTTEQNVATEVVF